MVVLAIRSDVETEQTPDDDEIFYYLDTINDVYRGFMTDNWVITDVERIYQVPIK